MNFKSNLKFNLKRKDSCFALFFFFFFFYPLNKMYQESTKLSENLHFYELEFKSSNIFWDQILQQLSGSGM